jgi:hypothetical protein
MYIGMCMSEITLTKPINNTTEHSKLDTLGLSKALQIGRWQVLRTLTCSD